MTSHFSSQWWFVLTWTQSWQNSNGWWLLCVIRMCRLPSRNWAWCHSHCTVHLFTWFWSGNVVSNKNLKYSGVFILTDRIANCWLFSQATCSMSFSTLYSSSVWRTDTIVFAKLNKNVLTAEISLACLDIRSRNEEVVDSTRNRIY